jgi:hypothetical protein
VKYFHNLSSSCRNINHILNIIDAEGTFHSGQQALKTTIVRHFQPFSEEKTTGNLHTSVTVASLFPHYFTKVESLTLDSPYTIQEIRASLKYLSKDKSPGPDNWTIEFYLHFFHMVGQDILELVEDSRLSGKVVGALNLTFLTLIPKTNNPSTFFYYRPISLCNLCYKFISKIIATRIKPYSLGPFRKNSWGF